MSSQKKKVTLYFNAAMLSETQREALRQDRSISWIIQAAWRIAREEVKRLPEAVSRPAAADQVAPAPSGPAATSDSAVSRSPA